MNTFCCGKGDHDSKFPSQLSKNNIAKKIACYMKEVLATYQALLSILAQIQFILDLTLHCQNPLRITQNITGAYETLH